MKKIVWIYGQSATGKKTLINKLLNRDSQAINELGMNDFKIAACKNTIEDNEYVVPTVVDHFKYDDKYMQEDNEYFCRKNAINRRSCIMTDCLNFIESDNDILLIKGQDNDFWPGRGDIVKCFLENFSNIAELEIEVLMLTVQNDEIWENRIKNKEWFKKFEDKTGVMDNMRRTRLEQKHESAVIDAFSGYDVSFVFVDSGENCYTILNDFVVKGRK